VTDWVCPLPLRSYDRVTLGHGGGGQLTHDLVEHLILPAFGVAAGDATVDSAVLPVDSGRLAFTTDSHVVQPLFFPGGDIGELAVNGTVNDLAMVGAQPLALAVGFVLEEGLELEALHRICQSLGMAAQAAGTQIAAGDTKVVERGQADGIYITTSGVGLVATGVHIAPTRAAPGDSILLSGPLGNHGIAVLSVRDGLAFGTEVRSDTAPLNGLVSDMIDAHPDIHVLRDLTRGGLAAGLSEIATDATVGINLVQASLPIPSGVAAACGLLGLDPLEVANEGVLVAVVPSEAADAVLDAMRRHKRGRGAVSIGSVTAENPGRVIMETTLGANRVVDRPLGEQLPRIC
jgi:hydrogenase expression/formation protein HypE